MRQFCEIKSTRTAGVVWRIILGCIGIINFLIGFIVIAEGDVVEIGVLDLLFGIIMYAIGCVLPIVPVFEANLKFGAHQLNIRTVGNRIYFYLDNSDVSKTKVLPLKKAINANFLLAKYGVTYKNVRTLITSDGHSVQILNSIGRYWAAHLTVLYDEVEIVRNNVILTDAIEKLFPAQIIQQPTPIIQQPVYQPVVQPTPVAAAPVQPQVATNASSEMALFVCGNCNAKLKEFTKFCPHCAAPSSEFYMKM